MLSAGEGPMFSVSVIVPTYNRAAYLQEALESIFQQTLPPAEIIVVDDGSTDDTEDTVQRTRKPIRFYRQEHEGVAAARNLGLQMATGDLIAWLDTDDLWEPEFLATLVSLLIDDPELDGVYCGLTHMDVTGKNLPTPELQVIAPQRLYSALIESDFIVTPAIVAHKRCYDQVGPFDLEFRICEDYDMWLRLAKHFTIAGTSQALVRIRVHESSTMMGDRLALCKYRLALTQKHFGTREGDPGGWQEDKRRAYSFAFLTCALRYIEDGESEEGWRYFQEAASVWPALFNRLDVFYELACGAQARGYRGRVDLMDIGANGRELLNRLDALFDTSSPTLRRARGKAHGNAYLALGMLSDQAGHWAEARSYLLRAITANPGLATSPSVARRLVKLCSGRRLARFARLVRDARADSAYGNRT